MTITIEKKHLIIFSAIILFCTATFIIIKACSGSKVDYEKTAKEAKLNAYTVVSLSSVILEDYHNVWSKTIDDDGIYVNDEMGVSRYCRDFSTAIGYRMSYYRFDGFIDIIDSLSNVVKEDLKLMDDAPKEYQEIQKTFVAMFGDMNSLASLVKDPKGSLFSFSRTVNELEMSFDKNFKETDLKVSVSDDELKEQTKMLMEILAKKKLEADVKREGLYDPNKKAGEKFLAENAKKEGVNVLPCGVQYKIIKKGNGNIPSNTSRVKVNYEGKLIDGSVFDSSYERNQPFEVNMAALHVIQGWVEVLKIMPEGSIWEVYIPQELAYKNENMGVIKPFSALIFKIEIMKVIN